jgi:hypothetical protein
MTLFFRLPILLLLIFAYTFAACDSNGTTQDGDDPSPPASNALALTIVDNGEETLKTIEAYTYFSTTTDSTGATAFSIFFTDEETFSESSTERGFFGSAVRMSPRPAVGAYAASSVEDGESFTNGQTFLISFSEVSGPGSSIFYSVEGGDVDITRSESGRVDGDLFLQGRAISFDGSTQSEQRITITGSFRASSLGDFEV